MTSRKITEDVITDPGGRPSIQEPTATALRQANELRFLILAAQREGNRQLAQGLRPVGLTPAQAEIISTLDEHEPLTLAGLGRYIVCETGSPSRLVDALVKRGLIERENGQADRRVVHLRLSPEGRGLIADIAKADHQLDSAIAEVLEGKDVHEITAAMYAIVRGTAAGSKVVHRFSSSP